VGGVIKYMSFFLHNLLGMKPEGFGLEIEDRSLKAFMFRRGSKNRCRILSCGMRVMKKGLIQEGQILNPQAVAADIKELLKTTKPKPIVSRSVVFSIPETKAFMRTIAIPKMEKEEAVEAVKWETEANIPVAVDRIYLDWQAINEVDGKAEILVAAIPKEVVDSYCETMKLAGLDILAVEVDIIATVRSLASERETREKPVMIVDLGEDKTSLAICKNQVPYFTSSLPLSGRTFTDALSKGLGVSTEKAENLKIKYGLGKMQKDDMLFNIYNPLVENLAVEIEKSISFYEESINTREKVEMIILSGGGSLLKDFSECMEKRIGKKIILGNPLKSLGMENKFSDDFQKSLAPFATSIGLAARLCENND